MVVLLLFVLLVVLIGDILLGSYAWKANQERVELRDKLASANSKIDSLQEELKMMTNEFKLVSIDRHKLLTTDNPVVAEIGEIACDGLLTDGGHHKQWYLEEIAKKCGTTDEWLDENVDRGIPS